MGKTQLEVNKLQVTGFLGLSVITAVWSQWPRDLPCPGLCRQVPYIVRVALSNAGGDRTREAWKPVLAACASKSISLKKCTPSGCSVWQSSIENEGMILFFFFDYWVIVFAMFSSVWGELGGESDWVFCFLNKRPLCLLMHFKSTSSTCFCLTQELLNLMGIFLLISVGSRRSQDPSFCLNKHSATHLLSQGFDSLSFLTCRPPNAPCSPL